MSPSPVSVTALMLIATVLSACSGKTDTPSPAQPAASSASASLPPTKLAVVEPDALDAHAAEELSNDLLALGPASCGAVQKPLIGWVCATPELATIVITANRDVAKQLADGGSADRAGVADDVMARGEKLTACLQLPTGKAACIAAAFGGELKPATAIAASQGTGASGVLSKETLHQTQLADSMDCFFGPKEFTAIQTSSMWSEGQTYTTLWLSPAGIAQITTRTRNGPQSQTDLTWSFSPTGYQLVAANKETIQLLPIRSWKDSGSVYHAIRYVGGGSAGVWTCHENIGASVAQIEPKAKADAEAEAARPKVQRVETREEGWVREMRKKGQRCAGVADFVESKMQQFGNNSPMVTRAFEIAADKGCF